MALLVRYLSGLSLNKEGDNLIFAFGYVQRSAEAIVKK